jgi:hypothetical protein
VYAPSTTSQVVPSMVRAMGSASPVEEQISAGNAMMALNTWRRRAA